MKLQHEQDIVTASFPSYSFKTLTQLLASITLTSSLLLACARGDSAADPDPATRGYLGSVSIEIPGNEWSSYTAIVHDVDSTTDDSLRAGLETTGWVAPSTYQGAIFVPNHSAATLSKYTTDASGLVEEGTLSFQEYGISWIAPVFIAPDKAYVFDDKNLQIIVFDPTAMELTGHTIDLSSLLSGPVADKPGYAPATLADYGKQRDGRLFVPVRWANWDSTDRFVPLGALLIIDTENDEPLKLLQDYRLTDSIYTVMSDAGDIYLFTGAIGVSFNHVLGTGRPGGALRVRHDREEFDPDYYVNLNDAVDGRPASTPVLASGTSVYLKAFHEEHAPIDAELAADPSGMLSKAAWRYWEVDLEGGEPAREIREIPLTSTDGFFYDLRPRGPLFIGVMAADYGSTTLYEAQADSFERAIDVTGVLQVLTPFAPQSQ